MDFKYNLYVINSTYSISKLNEIFKKYTINEDDIFAIRKSYSRLKDTNSYYDNGMRYVLITKKLFENLLQNNLASEEETESENILYPYVFRKNDFPDEKFCVFHCFFPVTEDKNQVERIRNNLKFFTNKEFISEDDYTLHECGIIEFSDKVNKYKRLIIKIFLDNPIFFRVSWCHEFFFSKR